MTPLLFLYDPLKWINQAFYFFENLQIFKKLKISKMNPRAIWGVKLTDLVKI